MKKIFVPTYVAFGAIILFGLIMTNIIMHAVTSIERATPQAFAEDSTGV